MIIDDFYYNTKQKNDFVMYKQNTTKANLIVSSGFSGQVCDPRGSTWLQTNYIVIVVYCRQLRMLRGKRRRNGIPTCLDVTIGNNCSAVPHALP